MCFCPMSSQALYHVFVFCFFFMFLFAPFQDFVFGFTLFYFILAALLFVKALVDT